MAAVLCVFSENIASGVGFGVLGVLLLWVLVYDYSRLYNVFNFHQFFPVFRGLDALWLQS